MFAKLLLLSITISSLLLLEKYFPFFKFKNRLGDRITTNLYLGGITAIVSISFTSIVAIFIARLPPAPVSIASSTSPLFALGLSFIILDLYMYAWHRLMHVFPLAWRFHRVHHTDLFMNVSTAYRFHAIEVICSNLPKLLLVWGLGITAPHVFIYESVFTIVVALHHSNVRLPEGLDRYLSYLIVTPNYHRIHHSQIIAETNSNYGSVLTCWDRSFGTNHDRQDLERIELGIKESPNALNLWELLTLPFARS